MRRLEKTELLQAIAAWSYAAGAGTDLRTTLPAALEWLRRQWEIGNDHLPLDLVHDLGQLLILGRDFRFRSDRSGAQWTEVERRWRLDYEDRVLGRWALDRTLVEAHVVIAGMSAELREEAVCHAIGLALGRRETDDLVLGNPAFLRSEWQRIERFVHEIPEDPDAWSEIVDPAWIEWALAQRRAALASQQTRLFSEEDLWELAHIEHLPNESTRLALRQIHEAVTRIGPIASATALRLGRQAREIPVDEEAVDQYPAGGFESLSTRGRFENLVRSEIGYVGEGPAEGGVDLFDVRFAQGELLFYTRDESPMLDARREMTVVVDRAHQMRHKHPALPAQTLVLVQALALRLQSDLATILGPSGAVLALEWLTRPEDLDVVAEERRSLRLSLADEIAHHRARLGQPTAWSEAGARSRIVFSPGPNVSGVDTSAWVRVGEQHWLLDEEAVDVSSPAGMRVLADLLLARVLQPGRPA